MQAAETAQAVAAARSIAAALGLAADDAVVLNNSNKLAVRLLPGGVAARVAPLAQKVAQFELGQARFEVDLAGRLAAIGSPVAALAAPGVYECDGFVVTLWTYYPQVTPGEVAPADYAKALERLHAGMRRVDLASPHFTDRVEEAQQLVANRPQTPELADADRELLGGMLSDLRRTTTGHGAAEQLLHGEPHPGNLLGTQHGPRFIDFETCCRGPVEFDLAHAPAAVAEHYPGADPDLLGDCRGLILAMVAAWRWDAGDQFPNGRRAGHDLVGALREGPPWPTLDVMMRRLAGP